MANAQTSMKGFQKMDLTELRSLMDVQTEEEIEVDVFAYVTEIFSGLVLKVKHFMLIKQSMKPMVFKHASEV